MMRRLDIWLLALGLHGLAISAAAHEAYVVGSAGRANWAYDCGPNGCQRDTTAWRIAAGYRFNRVVALEGFYFDFGRARSSNFSVDGKLGATGAGVQSLIGWQFGAFDFAGKIGLASMTNDFRASPTSSYPSSRMRRTELVGGLMSAYHLTPALSVRLDVDILTVALNGDAVYYSRGSDVTTGLFGLIHRF
jgi:hypothetical protein